MPAGFWHHLKGPAQLSTKPVFFVLLSHMPAFPKTSHPEVECLLGAPFQSLLHQLLHTLSSSQWLLKCGRHD